MEIPAGFLSGDEAMEKSFSVNSMYRSEASGHRKASLALSSVMVAKSILGVGILGLVRYLLIYIALCYSLIRYFDDCNTHNNILFSNIICYFTIA